MAAMIDTNFDFRSDTPNFPKRDPDKDSPTLRQYHRLLWSKPLPNGHHFDLVDTTPRTYLHHKSELGEFWLGSDSVVPSFTRNYKIQHIIEQVPPDELDQFNTIGYTIGGMMLWPAERIDRKMTINGARGFHPRLADRFDLTVECVLRHYRGKQSPLSKVLERYSDFFNLFGSFQGFVDFFLLQDIVSEDFQSVKMFSDFDDFTSSPLPSSKDEYMSYKRLAIEFIEARNRRIERYWIANGGS
jgi:hypothetical protein